MRLLRPRCVLASSTRPSWHGPQQRKCARDPSGYPDAPPAAGPSAVVRWRLARCSPGKLQLGCHWSSMHRPAGPVRSAGQGTPTAPLGQDPVPTNPARHEAQRSNCKSSNAYCSQAPPSYWPPPAYPWAHLVALRRECGAHAEAQRAAAGHAASKNGRGTWRWTRGASLLGSRCRHQGCTSTCTGTGTSLRLRAGICSFGRSADSKEVVEPGLQLPVCHSQGCLVGHRCLTDSSSTL